MCIRYIILSLLYYVLESVSLYNTNERRSLYVCGGRRGWSNHDIYIVSPVNRGGSDL